MGGSFERWSSSECRPTSTNSTCGSPTAEEMIDRPASMLGPCPDPTNNARTRVEGCRPNVPSSGGAATCAAPRRRRTRSTTCRRRWGRRPRDRGRSGTRRRSTSGRPRSSPSSARRTARRPARSPAPFPASRRRPRWPGTCRSSSPARGCARRTPSAAPVRARSRPAPGTAARTPRPPLSSSAVASSRASAGVALHMRPVAMSVIDTGPVTSRSSVSASMARADSGTTVSVTPGAS